MPYDKLRLSSKKFFLIYPQVYKRLDSLIILSKQDIKDSLCNVFQNRDLRFFMIVEEFANDCVPYDHFCVFILLNKVKNIINSKSLDIKGVSGMYYSSRRPIFEQYDIQNVEYVQYEGNVENVPLEDRKMNDSDISICNSSQKNQNELIRELIAHI
nr:hypothetical protein [Gracilaria tikvahiae]